MFWIIPEHSKLICPPNLSNLRFRELIANIWNCVTDRTINLRIRQTIGLCGLKIIKNILHSRYFLWRAVLFFQHKGLDTYFELMNMADKKNVTQFFEKFYFNILGESYEIVNPKNYFRGLGRVNLEVTIYYWLYLICSNYLNWTPTLFFVNQCFAIIYQTLIFSKNSFSVKSFNLIKMLVNYLLELYFLLFHKLTEM